MTDLKGWIAGVADEAVGIAKRAIGELTARPDFVLEGEKQQALGRKEIETAQQEGKVASGHRVIGWKLDPAERPALLGLFPPRYAETVADHVTLGIEVSPEVQLPPHSFAQIVGESDDGAGVQALIVAIEGNTARPGGGTYHITWSLDPGRRAADSNAVIARLGWTPLAEPRSCALHPAEI